MRAFRVVVELARVGRQVKEVREPADVADLLQIVKLYLRETVDSNNGGCGGFTVTVHPVGEGCDHEL